MLENYTLEDLKFSENYLHCSNLTLNIAIDLGSTETRSICWDPSEEEMPLESVEPSFYHKGQYSEDFSDIKIMSPKLYDCLEFRLRTLTEEKYSFLKGSLAKQAGISNSVTSSASKADHDATQINIHSTIAMEYLNKIIKERIKFHSSAVVQIKLTIALPPEDTDRGRVDTIKDNLSGVYEIYMPRLDMTFSYSINRDDIVIISECNATATYYAVVEDDGSVMEHEENVIIFEGGGRSSSIAIIKDGVLISRNNFNCNDVSGKKLREMLSGIISDSKGISRLTEGNLERVLTTGLYRVGRDSISADDELYEAKSQFAKECIKPLFLAIDTAGVAASDVQRIVFSGRLFNETANPESQVVTPSLAEFVIKEFNSTANARADILRVSKEYPIPQGLVIYRMGIDQ